MDGDALRHVLDADPDGNAAVRLAEQLLCGDRDGARRRLLVVREHLVEENHRAGVRHQLADRREFTHAVFRLHRERSRRS